jgi:alkanesulfonate monooxygenase SsuD/methylene tetrahydromethanopterin reductase-like flavin-dependent oxidoreductase (luciferase family)
MEAAMTNGATGRRMKLGVMPSLGEGSMDGATPRYADIQAMAQTAERIGLDSFWLADHLIYRYPERDESGCWEVFTFLSAVAAVTSKIEIGPLVACTSFRNPALLAKMADALDEISNGRFILGLGCGWHEPEYDAFGYPFDHRVGRFEEAMAIIAPLLREGRVDFHGKYYEVNESVLKPRGPSATGPKLWIGSKAPRMLELTAKYADAWNTVWHIDPAVVLERYAPLKEACAKAGRDLSTLELTAGTYVRFPEPGVEDDGKSITGTDEEIAAQLQAFADIGVTHLIVILRPSTSPATIGRFARVVEVLDRG